VDSESVEQGSRQRGQARPLEDVVERRAANSKQTARRLRRCRPQSPAGDMKRHRQPLASVR
jgi:hypothetical protein